MDMVISVLEETFVDMIDVYVVVTLLCSLWLTQRQHIRPSISSREWSQFKANPYSDEKY